MKGAGRIPAVLLALLAPLLPGRAAWAQILQGRVMDEQAGSPIPLASVKLIEIHSGVSQSGLTNDAGSFQFQVDSEGPFILDIFALGYLPQVDTLRVPSDEERLAIEVRLGVNAIPLDPLQVTASRSPWWEVTEPRMLWSYHERKDFQRKLGLGRFYEREDLKMQFAAGPLSLLVEMWPPRAETPSEFLDSDSRCGVMVFWTFRSAEIG